MTKTGRKKRFALGMLIYAVVFLLIAAAGLAVFWQFIEAYELSRPKTAVDAYIDSLTSQQIRSCSEEFLASLDGNIQTPDQAFEIMENALAEGITAAKNGRESSSEKMVYMLRSGEQTIGSVTIVPGDVESFGFTPWQVTEEVFDFAYLLHDGMTITVPAEFAVSLNGNTLNDSYITESDIPYSALEAFHGEFEMPTMVTYTVDNFLGDLPFAVSDSFGSPVEITPETDLNQFIPGCSEEEEAQLRSLTAEFLATYINYTGSANRMAHANLSRLKLLLVKGGELSERLSAAFGSLVYAQSYGDEILSTSFNGIYKLSTERYMCDVSYVLQSIGHKGAVDTQQNMKIVFLMTNDGLRVEAITLY